MTNGIPLLVPSVVGVDVRWCMIDELPEALQEYGKSRVTYPRFCTKLNKHQVTDGIVVRHHGRHVMDNPMELGFFWQGSVGHMACHLAWFLGARKVYVWGLDYKSKERSYDHVDPSLKAPEGERWLMQNIEVGWDKLRTGLRDLGCEVYNCNPCSELRALPMITPEGAILEE